MTDANDALMIGTRTDGTLVRRPLSPHIGIYRWPVTMAASIMNRITGVTLSIGTLLLVWWLVAAASGPAEFARVQGFLASPIGLLALLGWTASLFYHLFAGLRHLIWDNGLGFGKHSLNAVSWLVIGATGLATAIVWIAAYAVLGA